mgnify:CR=1 FL=1
MIETIQIIGAIIMGVFMIGFATTMLVVMIKRFKKQ